MNSFHLPLLVTFLKQVRDASNPVSLLRLTASEWAHLHAAQSVVRSSASQVIVSLLWMQKFYYRDQKRSHRILS